MKFIFGMLTGILISTMFFIWYAKKNLTTPNNAITDQIVSSVATTDEDDFATFYERFHRDSLFQLSHITFPLEGVPRLDSTRTYPEDFRWQEENWVLHRPFNTKDSSFVQELMAVGDAMMVENIRTANAFFSMQRRFAKIGEEWHLIYYAAMNQTSEE